MNRKMKAKTCIKFKLFNRIIFSIWDYNVILPLMNKTGLSYNLLQERINSISQNYYFPRDTEDDMNLFPLVNLLWQ